MESDDKVVLSLSVYEAVDRQDPETLLQPQQTRRRRKRRWWWWGKEAGGKEGRAGNVVRQTSLFTLFFCGFLEVRCERGQLDT